MPQATPTPTPAPPPVAARPPQRPALPGVVFDSDMGENIDSALALALLYGASSKAKLVGITVSNSDLQAVAYCEVLGRFYASGGRLRPALPRYYSPIGFNGDSPGASHPMVSKPLALTAQDGGPLYGNDIRSVVDTAEVGVVFRNALLGQKDGEGIVVVAGPLTNLARAMALPGNKELIAMKVGLLVVGAGWFGETTGEIDSRIRTDIASARKILTEWPGQIVFAGREAGMALPYPGATIAKDFEWAPSHPIVDAYKAFQPMPYDAPSQAVLAALYAISSNEDLFPLSEPGRVAVQNDGRTVFTPLANGKHRLLLTKSDATWKSKVTETFTKLTSSKPAAGGGRGGFPPQLRPNQPAPAAGAAGVLTGQPQK